MSWVFGITANPDLIDNPSLLAKKILPANHKLIKEGNHVIFFSDKVNLLFSEPARFIIRGFGLLFKHNKYQWMNQHEWDIFLKNPMSFTTSGQYLIIQWNREEIRFSNDFFGLNSIYIYKKDDIIYYSTRLDYLCQIMPSPKINFKAFAGRWILFNQLSSEAIVDDLIKLPPNSEIKVYKNTILVTTKDQNYKPKNNINFHEIIDQYCDIVIPDNYNITLGLSGGLDSRFLLDRFLNRNSNISLHSYGNKYDNDVVIANEIANKINKELHILEGVVNQNNILNDLEEYLVLNEIVDTISTYLLTSGVQQDYFNNKILIDGAGGELYRRQFHNRLLIKGKADLKEGNPTAIFKYLNLFRADIFNADVNIIMYKAALNQISGLIEKLPEIEKTGIENFVDLFVAITRFPNYYGPEQNHLNSIVPNFMPFVTEELFQKALGLPLKERLNNKMFYDYLRRSNHGLSKIRLVKDGVIYPFGLGSKSIYLLVNLKKRLFGIHRNNLTKKFFYTNKAMVFDILSSDDVRKNELYNLSEIDQILNKIYSGDDKYLNQIDWLFSFELFRKKLKLNI